MKGMILAAGVGSIVANLHYMPGLVEGHFGNGSGFGVKLTYSREKELLGTAAGSKR